MPRVQANTLFVVAAAIAVAGFAALMVTAPRTATDGPARAPGTGAPEPAAPVDGDADPARAAADSPDRPAANDAGDDASPASSADEPQRPPGAGDDVAVSPGRVVLELDDGSIVTTVRPGSAGSPDGHGPIDDAAGSLAVFIESRKEGSGSHYSASLIARDVPAYPRETVLVERRMYLLADAARAFRYTPENGVLVPGNYALRVAVTDGPTESAPFTIVSQSPWAERQGETEAPGGHNVALAAAGGRVVSAGSEYNDSNWAADNLIDGFALIRDADGDQLSSGWRSARGALPVELVFDFREERPARIHAVAFETVRRVASAADSVAAGRKSIIPYRVEVLVAAGDEEDAYQRVADARLYPQATRQSLRFAPVEARFVKLVLHSNYGESTVGLGEVAILEDPGADASILDDAEPNLAHPALGGRLVAFTSQAEDNPAIELVDGRTANDAGWVSGDGPRGDAGFLPQRFVFSFRNGQAPLIDRVAFDVLSGREGWGRDEAAWPAEVAVSVADEPGREFTEVGRRTLAAKPGEQALEVGRRARYVEVKVLENHGAPRTSLGEVRIVEGQAPGYRSILRAPSAGRASALRGAGAPDGASPAPPGAAGEAEPNDRPDAANELAADEIVAGRIEPADDVDYYALGWEGDAPGILNVELAAAPRLWMSLSLVDTAGERVRHHLPPSASADATRVSWQLPPAAYRIGIAAQPVSTVLVWDVSGSMEGRVDAVRRAVETYVERLQPAESVRLVRFNDEVSVLGERFVDDAPRLSSLLAGQFEADGGTALYDALVEAAELLEARRGRRVLLILSDGGDTASLSDAPTAWHALLDSGASVHSIGLGWEMRNLYRGSGSTGAAGLAHLSEATGGRYVFAPDAETLTEIYRLIAADLSQPVRYAVRASTGQGRGTLAVEATGERIAALSAPSRFQLVLDASGSMKEPMNGSTRMAVARDAVDEVLQGLPADVEVGLRAFGHRVREGQPGDCTDTEQLVAAAPVGDGAVRERVRSIEALGTTLIAESMRRAVNDLADIDGEKMVILVTDGEEECSDDPAAEIRQLLERTAGLRLNIVGFALQDAAVKAQLRELARLTGGAFFDAAEAGALRGALDEALSASYAVQDASGTTIGTGRVGGGPVQLPAGTYDVVVRRRGEPLRIAGVNVGIDARTGIALEKEGDLIDVEVDAPPLTAGTRTR